MIFRLSLTNKFILILITVFLVGASVSWYQIKALQYKKTQEELVFDSRLVLETMIAVRTYTGEHINQHLKPLQKTNDNQHEFIKESAPSFAANNVFNILKRNQDYKDFEYKEAALNPTNVVDNLADSFETALLEKFISNPDLSELSGPRIRNGEEFFYTARPIQIKTQSCLLCHSTPDAAPAALRATYGDNHGFGWQLGETVAVRMVYVPGKRVSVASYDNAISIAGMLLPVFIALALAILLLIRRTVVEPVQHLRAATHALGTSAEHIKTDSPFWQKLNAIVGRKDEIGNLAKDFLLMASIIKNRESRLVDQNKELNTSKSSLQAVLDNATDSIISINDMGIIQSCNPATDDMFGYQKNELLGQKVNILMQEPYSSEHDNYLKNYLNAIIGIGQELEGLRKDGSCFNMELTVSKMHINDQCMFTGFVRDITERDQQIDLQHKASLERASIRAESAAKSSFLANMSHEIRTPLAAIIGYAESVLDSNNNIEQRLAAIRTIIRNGNYLLHIINEILDLSKIESSNFEVSIESISLFNVLQDVQRLAEIQAKSKDLTFTIDYHFPLPVSIQSDALRLKQILINLCNNAIKFTQSGGVTVEVKYIDESIFISVIDTGKGLSNEQIKQIFNEYVQADYLTYSEHGGTGLGLPISKKLADKLGGNISVQSDVNSGSQFTVCLPAPDADKGELLTELPDIKVLTSENKSTLLSSKLTGHVLIAEDNVDIASLVGIYLTNLGLEYTHVENGKEAAEAALHNDYDLILMDMQMPIMNGIEAVKQIKQSNNTTPIIMLTANAMLKDKEASIEAGCIDFLSKPLDRVIFVRTLTTYLEADNTPDIDSDELIVVEQDEGMQVLIERFIDGLPAQLAQLNKAEAEDDWEELKSIFHQLKGIGGGLGFPQVSELASRTQFQVIRQNKYEIKSAIAELEALHRKIVKRCLGQGKNQ